MEHVDPASVTNRREGAVYVTDRSCLSVARTVRLPLPDVAESAGRLRAGHDPVRALSLPGGGRLEVALPLRRDEWAPLGRRDLAPARTFGALHRRSNRRLCPVEVEISPWSLDVTEVLLRPAVRSPYQWSDRRTARWFSLAHDAADALRAELLAHSVVPAVPVEDGERHAIAV
jgi:hypothetical protein